MHALLLAGILAAPLGFARLGHAGKAARPCNGRAVAGHPPARARGGRHNGTCCGGGGVAAAAQGFRARPGSRRGWRGAREPGLAPCHPPLDRAGPTCAGRQAPSWSSFT